MPDELGLLMVQLIRQDGFDPKSVDGVVVASVVPPLNSALVQAIERYFDREPLVVGPGVKTGLKIHYRDPKEVGADRIVAAMAAFKKYGGPLIIIEYGTGTTYDVVSKEGDYLGGAIAPGMGISVDALYERAARLQRVELKSPPTVIGRTTAESMQAGIIFGFTAQVEGMVARIKKELGENPRVIATGGLAGLIAAEPPVIELVDQQRGARPPAPRDVPADGPRLGRTPRLRSAHGRRPPGDGTGGPPGRSGGRRHRRHQYGLPGAQSRQDVRWFLAASRSGPRLPRRGSGGRGGVGASHGQDPPWLGLCHPQLSG